MLASLGYSIHPEEDEQDPGLWRIQRFPRPFLRMLRTAVIAELMSAPTAASFAGVAVPDIVQILGRPHGDAEQEQPQVDMEFGEFETTGVI